jgi:hypothetical protein
MSLSTYSITVPVFTRALKNLSAILTKAAAWAEERKINPSVLINARLAPDMHPLSFQVQSSTDRVKFTFARLNGTTAPSWPDTEATFPELQQRIQKALDYLATISEADLASAEDRDVTLKIGGKDTTIKGSTYVLERQLPNFWFHVTTAYDILRNQGVPIGKSDFIG